MQQTIFISGIDTDAGKTFCTAWLAKQFMDKGLTVATQKFIQTGNTGHSEDIEMHRRLTGSGPIPEDKTLITSPIIFPYPASAQLAARLHGTEINLALIDQSRQTLASRYNILLIEGAGGLMVPITDDFLTIDYITSRHLPLALVTNSVLGSINHTILSLEAIAARNIPLPYILYNTHFDTNPTIAADTLGFIRRYTQKHFPKTQILTVPSFK